MYRCKETLDILQKTVGPTFIVMDEIFNSTNIIEGIAGAYAIAKHMALKPNLCCIISTHYVYLSKLSKHTGKFTNFKVNVDISDNGNINYPYKLCKGVSRQYIALELLKINNFNPNILEDALQIKHSLLAASKS